MPMQIPFSLKLLPLSLALFSLGQAVHAECSPANAKGCGKTIYLGKTSDNKQSVWLSLTHAGKFDISSAKTNQPYDVWTTQRKSLHLTLSPEVEEWGGTHILYYYKDANTSVNDRLFVSSDNQTPDGMVFPPNWKPPVIRPPEGGGPLQPITPERPTLPNRPGGVKPPIGTLPPEGITPERPTLPNRPGGVKPPIGTLPPEGITPERPTLPSRPGGVKPPIGTLPPEGITPELPGGVQPPIAVLPPEGITPERPTLPNRPGGVKPPIGTLPPEGITPERPTLPNRPGGVTPPIGTLPPEGITPERPTLPNRPGGVKPPIGTLPPEGITPELPGGVQPPIAVLPPEGITPERPTLPNRPGGVKPPIGTLPPEGITPELPGGVQPPIAVLPPEGIMPERPTIPDRPGGVVPPIAVIPPESGSETVSFSGHARTNVQPIPDCPAGRVDTSGVEDPAQLADCAAPLDAVTRSVTMPEAIQLDPLTPGRYLVEPTLWNAWANAQFTRIDDHRDGIEGEASNGSLSVGVDRQLDNGMVAGMMLAFNRSNSEQFWGYMTQDSNGIQAGPYVSFRLSSEWSLFSSLLFGRTDTEHRVVTLSGDSVATNLAASIEAQGNYAIGQDAFVRPKFTMTYQKDFGESYSLRGNIADRQVEVNLDGGHADSGTMQGAVEFSWLWRGNGGLLVMPYAEAGAQYAYLRQDSGAIEQRLRGEDESRWLGMLRGGARILTSKTSLLEIGAAYQSIGVKDLDVWEFKLLFSNSF